MTKLVNKEIMDEYRGPYNPNDKAYWCRKCQGEGFVDEDRKKVCPICNGEGLINVKDESAKN